MNKSLLVLSIIISLCASLDGAISSLTDLSDYVYTSHTYAPSYVQGKVMGDTPSYRIPRIEDIMFLEEGESEFNHVYNSFFNPTSSQSIPTDYTSSLVLKRRTPKNTSYTVNQLFNNDSYTLSLVDGDATLKNAFAEYSPSSAKIDVYRTVCNTTNYNEYSLVNKLLSITNRVLKTAFITDSYKLLSEFQSKKVLYASIVQNGYTFWSMWYPTGQTIATHLIKDSTKRDNVAYYYTDDGHGHYSPYWEVSTYQQPSHTESSSSQNFFSFQNKITIEQKAYTGFYYEDNEDAPRTLSSVSQYDTIVEYKATESNDCGSQNNVWTYLTGGFMGGVKRQALELGGIDHIESVNALAFYNVSISDNVYGQKWNNGNRNNFNTTTTTNICFYAPIQCNIVKVTGDDYYRFEFPIHNAKQHFQGAYPQGYYGDVIPIDSPSYPTVSDTNADSEGYHDITWTADNQSARTIDFKITLIGFAVLFNLKYHTTYQ